MKYSTNLEHRSSVSNSSSQTFSNERVIGPPAASR
jgi:hypothetical protein